jgi:hypothetical protein
MGSVHSYNAAAFEIELNAARALGDYAIVNRQTGERTALSFGLSVDGRHARTAAGIFTSVCGITGRAGKFSFAIPTILYFFLSLFPFLSNGCLRIPLRLSANKHQIGRSCDEEAE